MPRRNRSDLFRWLQRLAVAGGTACIAWVGVATLRADLFDRRQRAVLQQQRTASPAAANVLRSAPATVAPGDVLALLEIPRLGFSELVIHGDDDQTLDLAIGHLPDTPLPWQPGNSAMAGHRDGHFRPLRDIRVGDIITLATRYGHLRYVLRSTKIVMPTDLSVLAPTGTRTLTLITCYPFSYVGRAPKRFVITADAIAD